MTLTPEEARALASSLLADDETGVGGGEPPARVARLLPEALGRYRVVRLLGVGGMGEVYEAEQETPRRRVALKVIRPELASPETLRRFDLEARILGRLQHPGIAQIFDAGRASGAAGETPYFAMEYVEGKPLPLFAKERGLGLRERLELFLKVCEAVEHAHRKGVIHRDLKPGNILVDGSGQPRVLDFGVARATDSDVRATTLHTDMGKLVGTLPYMSPEQAGGDPDALDTRSDVYSLGVVLYELLGERPPYEIKRGLIPEAVRIIREMEPAPLSSIDRVFRGDLETIAGKALAKEKERRYQSVGELAADIRRYLANEPIEARKASAIYQVRKFARRNKPIVAAGVAVIASLVLAALLSFNFAMRETRSRHNEEELRRTAEAREKEAIAQRDEIARLNSETREIVEIFQNMLGSVHPEVRGEEVRMIEVVRSVAEQIESNPSPRVRAAVAHIIGKSLAALGDYRQGARLVELAYRTLREEYGEYHEDTVNVLGDLAVATETLERFSEAESLSRQAVSAREATFGPHHAKTISSMNHLARVLLRRSKVKDALSIAEDASSRARAGLAPGDRYAIEARLTEGLIRRQSGDIHSARTILEEAHADAIAGLGAHSTPALTLARERAQTALECGELEVAERLALDAVDVHRRALGSSHPDALAATEILAQVYLIQKKPEEAEALYRPLVPVYRKVFGDDGARTLGMLNGFALALARQKMYDEACGVLAEIVDVVVSKYGENHPHTGIMKFNYAGMLKDAGRYREAVPYFDAAVTSISTAAPGSWQHGVFLAGRASNQTALGEFEKAYADAMEAIRLLERAVGTKHFRTADAVNNMIELLERWDRAEEAAEYRKRLPKEPAGQP